MAKIENFYKAFDTKIALYGKKAFDFTLIKKLLNEKLNSLDDLSQAQIMRMGGEDGVDEYKESINNYLKHLGDTAFFKLQSSEFFKEKYKDLLLKIDQSSGVKHSITPQDKKKLVKEYDSDLIDTCLDILEIKVANVSAFEYKKTSKDLISASSIEEYALILKELNSKAKNDYFSATMEFLDIYPPTSIDYSDFVDSLNIASEVNTQGSGASILTLVNKLRSFIGNGRDSRFEKLLISLVYYSPETLTLKDKFVRYITNGTIDTLQAQDIFDLLFQRIENAELAEDVISIWAFENSIEYTLGKVNRLIAYSTCPVCASKNKSSIFENSNGICRSCGFKYKDTHKFEEELIHLETVYDKRDFELLNKDFTSFKDKFNLEDENLKKHRLLAKILTAVASGKLVKSKEEVELDKLASLVRENISSALEVKENKSKFNHYLNEAKGFCRDLKRIAPNNIKTAVSEGYINWFDIDSGIQGDLLVDYFAKFKCKEGAFDEHYASIYIDWALENDRLYKRVKDYLLGHLDRVLVTKELKTEFKDKLFLKEYEDASLKAKFNAITSKGYLVSSSLASKIIKDYAKKNFTSVYPRLDDATIALLQEESSDDNSEHEVDIKQISKEKIAEIYKQYSVYYKTKLEDRRLDYEYLDIHKTIRDLDEYSSELSEFVDDIAPYNQKSLSLELKTEANEIANYSSFLRFCLSKAKDQYKVVHKQRQSKARKDKIMAFPLQLISLVILSAILVAISLVTTYLLSVSNYIYSLPLAGLVVLFFPYLYYHIVTYKNRLFNVLGGLIPWLIGLGIVLIDAYLVFFSQPGFAITGDYHELIVYALVIIISIFTSFFGITAKKYDKTNAENVLKFKGAIWVSAIIAIHFIPSLHAQFPNYTIPYVELDYIPYLGLIGLSILISISSKLISVSFRDQKLLNPVRIRVHIHGAINAIFTCLALVSALALPGYLYYLDDIPEISKELYAPATVFNVNLKNQVLMWDPIKNVESYRVYADDKLVATVQIPLLSLYDYVNEDAKIKVVATTIDGVDFIYPNEVDYVALEEEKEFSSFAQYFASKTLKNNVISDQNVVINYAKEQILAKDIIISSSVKRLSLKSVSAPSTYGTDDLISASFINLSPDLLLELNGVWLSSDNKFVINSTSYNLNIYSKGMENLISSNYDPKKDLETGGSGISSADLFIFGNASINVYGGKGASYYATREKTFGGKGGAAIIADSLTIALYKKDLTDLTYYFEGGLGGQSSTYDKEKNKGKGYILKNSKIKIISGKDYIKS
jgi:hypothetical protein